MSDMQRTVAYFALVAVLIIGTGMYQSWNSALFILNMGLISAILSLGVNLQWGIAGLLNVGVMGFVALGGVSTILISMAPVPAAWEAGGPRIFLGLAPGVATIAAIVVGYSRLPKGRIRTIVLLAIAVVGFAVYRSVISPAIKSVEAVNPALEGYLGGLGLPVLFAWPVGGLLAAGAAWVIGKTALGLRSDYLAIATLGISEIVVAVLKNEDWLARGVKNVNGIPRPVPYEIDGKGVTDFDPAGQNVIGIDEKSTSLCVDGLGFRHHQPVEVADRVAQRLFAEMLTALFNEYPHHGFGIDN